MSLQPLWDDGPVIATHALVATLAIVLGGCQLALPKGGRLHVALGRVWVAALGFVALSSFAIYGFRLIGPFSPIHALSILALVTLWSAVRAARRGDIERHKRTMVALYVYALGITGALTLWPGRTMHAVVFGG